MGARDPIRAPTFPAFAVMVLGLLALLAAPAWPADADSPITTGAQDANQPPSPGGWTLAAGGQQTSSFSSNPFLAIGKTTSLTGSTTEPQLLIKDASPTGLLSLETKMDENIFNQSHFNSTDIHASAGASQQNQRWAISVPQQIDYDTTRTSEISNFDLGVNSTRHFGYAATPQITFTPTSADSLALAGSVATSHYDSVLYTGYETYSVAPSYTRHVDPLNAAIVTLQAQRYVTTDNLPARVDSIGPTFGWSTALSPRLSANAAIGAQTSRTSQSGVAASPWAWQYIFSAGATFTGQQDAVAFNANRGQTPYGNGTDALQTSYGVSETRALNKILSLTVGGTYLSSGYQSYIPGSQRSYLSATTGLTYHATEHIDVAAAYTYRYETLVGSAGSARDHAVMLNVLYHPKLWTLFE